MFQLDAKFLDEIGLGGRRIIKKKPFLQHIYEELELRVGTKLSEGMTDEQLKEFESIIDRKEDVIIEWLSNNAPDFINDPIFGKLKESTGLEANNIALQAEFAATKWLEINRPNYRQVVESVLNEIKQEVIANRDAILSSSNSNQSTQ